MSEFSLLILNWNGEEDTAECLDSVLRSTRIPDRLFVLDNGSDPTRFEALKSAMDQRRLHDAIRNGASELLVERCEDNLGFAKGVNLGCRHLLERFGDHEVVILNNDTVVEERMFALILDTLASPSKPFMVAPRIMKWPDRERVWNCCGELLPFGLRRYHHADQTWRDAMGLDVRQVTFATGCCLAFRVGEFLRAGGFTEHFFFGEEDFELGHRLRRQGRTILCRRDAVMYHKIGATQRMMSPNAARRAYAHYLNRFIDVRLLGLHRPLPFKLWAWLYSHYIARILSRGGVSPSEIRGFTRELVREAAIRIGVPKERFLQIMSQGYTA